LECKYIATNIEKYKSLKGNQKAILSKIREIHKTLFNTKLPNNFAGVDVFTTLKLEVDKFNLNFKVFTRAPKTQNDNKPPYVHFQTVESA
jgi:hypothetical protein